MNVGRYPISMQHVPSSNAGLYVCLSPRAGPSVCDASNVLAGFRQRSSSLLPAVPAPDSATADLEKKVSSQRRQLHTLRERLEQFERGEVGSQVKQVRRRSGCDELST